MNGLRRTAWFSSQLRYELSERNRSWARESGVAREFSYGGSPCIVYSPDEDGRHGNFLPETYTAILSNENWSKRLKKVHTLARKSLPAADRRWRELDSANSSDALLMNVFCHPGVFANDGVSRVLGTAPEARPLFGHRARVPLKSGHSDRTEVDMLLGDLLVEAKLTESDFQQVDASRVEAYRDLETVFDVEQLPRIGEKLASYQLIRNVLAAHFSQCSFCVLCDARRPDLIENWYGVMRAVRLYELKVRLKLFTWQELSRVLPCELQRFLDAKYGIAS
jgi:hypothetical protein